MIRFIKERIRAALSRRRANPPSKAESAPAAEATTDNVGSTPDEQSTDTDVSTPSEPTAKPAIPDAVGVELQRRFNEFERRFNERQKEILDARAAYIERWLVAISVVAVVGGYLGFTKFDKIEDEARQHVTAAKQHAEKAQILVEKIEAKYGESVSLVEEQKKLNAETVGKNPDEAGRAAESIQEDPAASLIDRAMAAAVQLQLQGEIEKAVEKWRAIIHIAEGSDNDLAARAYFSVGYLLIKPEDAIAAYDQAIRLKPDYAEAYSNRGNEKNALGRHEDAIADCNQAVRLKPDLAEAYNNRGNAKGDLGRHEDAIADYKQAIRLKPDLAEAHNNRGKVKSKLGQHEDAITDYDEATRLKPDYTRAYLHRGIAKAALDLIDEARQDFEKARDLARKAGNDSLVALVEQRLRELDNREGE